MSTQWSFSVNWRPQPADNCGTSNPIRRAGSISSGRLPGCRRAAKSRMAPRAKLHLQAARPERPPESGQPTFMRSTGHESA